MPYNIIMTTQTTPRVIGRSKLDEVAAACDHCGRDIKNLVHLDNGQTVGTACALSKLGYKRASVDASPVVLVSLEHARGNWASIIEGGAVKRYVRTMIPGPAYSGTWSWSDWRAA